MKESDLTYEKASTLFALPADWETQQRKRWETLQGDLERAKGKESECTQRLATLHQQPTKAAQSEKELSTLLITLKKELKTVEASLASSHRRIVFEEASSERRRTLESELIKLMRESEPLLALRELIGSRDGHRFRQFAQSLSLHALLEATNYHLAEIAPRYRLEKQTESDLGLLVVDLEMGDERRLPESLSGGETFLVSLALALGLSSLSSEKTQIESLFIDEGFGTLDSESLEQALQALDQLQSHGCQVAIISHLPALIERIGCAVKVTPTRYGSSRVTVEEL